MKILIIGSGGREHALTWKIAQSSLVEKIYCAPGNPGMTALAECVAINANEYDALLDFAKDNKIDLVVVGPEDPLADGIVDRFKEAGIKAFGPSAKAAQLEASKSFAKKMMQRHNIPTAAYAEFDNAADAEAYVREQGVPIVIKADGLAAGKGVTVAQTVNEAITAIREALVDHVFGDAGARVIVEECMFGEEASIFALCDGEHLVALASSQDHKPAFDGDTGPNTGGMGAYSPAPVVTPELFDEIRETVLEACLQGMKADGAPYAGVLYAGLMVTETGPRVVEFNCRFGDPETQVVLPRMKSDIVPLMLACCDGTLADQELEWEDRECVTVVMASGGYPKSYEKGKTITGIAEAESDDTCMVFHAGTREEDGTIKTNGGRVLNVTAYGQDIATAIKSAYKGVEAIQFEDAFYRTDIGKKALDRLSS
ncbi:MAG TPA: phosphoribosylamine--glycine ligase [Candidatus Hydrogenedentes bacterium]|nr:phosphoribosylamine--glycine ligase [Candidatus Hydrogenedentota bacterium]